MENIEKYVKERDEMLLKGSVAELKKFIAKKYKFKIKVLLMMFAIALKNTLIDKIFLTMYTTKFVIW